MLVNLSVYISPKGHNRKVLGGIGPTNILCVLCSQPIEVIKQWSHLGHIISHDMDDRYDIMRCHDCLVRQMFSVFW